MGDAGNGAPQPGRAMVTGACGFIGTCLSLHLLERGWRVVGVDDLSRPGSQTNLVELRSHDGFELHQMDLADSSAVEGLFRLLDPPDAVFHLAAQVAVTDSYRDRRRDFESNVVGSFNLLEAVADRSPGAYCLYASTNKVYGTLDTDRPVDNGQPLDPTTPYGVSKAAAETYFLEYGRSPIGLTTCCLRQSCIYGHHQLGNEDQGWLAWFTVANLLGLPVRIYGDGEQVRDLLYVDDLVVLYMECLERRLRGVYTVGGGEGFSISLHRALRKIVDVTGRPFAEVTQEDPRPGDQPYFVADMGWVRDLGLRWRPETGIDEGLERMTAWLWERRSDLSRLHRGVATEADAGEGGSLNRDPVSDAAIESLLRCVELPERPDAGSGGNTTWVTGLEDDVLTSKY